MLSPLSRSFYKATHAHSGWVSMMDYQSDLIESSRLSPSIYIARRGQGSQKLTLLVLEFIINREVYTPCRLYSLIWFVGDCTEHTMFQRHLIFQPPVLYKSPLGLIHQREFFFIFISFIQLKEKKLYPPGYPGSRKSDLVIFN